jgi:hypothetical protein
MSESGSAKGAHVGTQVAKFECPELFRQSLPFAASNDSLDQQKCARRKPSETMESGAAA